MSYNSLWTSNLTTPEEKASFQNLLGVNNKVLDRLAEICYNMINELEDKSSDFNTPNWALHQAFLVGRRKELERIINLCSPAKQSDPTA